jgi:hypothetical protein
MLQGRSAGQVSENTYAGVERQRRDSPFFVDIDEPEAIHLMPG